MLVRRPQDASVAGRVSFAQLLHAANRLAALLLQRQGAQRWSSVGISCGHGANRVLAVLGAFIAGLPFVPLDPTAVGGGALACRVTWLLDLTIAPGGTGAAVQVHGGRRRRNSRGDRR